MDRQDGTDALRQFTWERQPEAERVVMELASEFLERSDESKRLSERMRAETGTRFVDWVDYFRLPATNETRARLERAGFVRSSRPGAPDCFVQPHGVFPAIVLSGEPKLVVGIKVDSVSDFMAVWQVTFEHAIEGDPYSPVRRACAFFDMDAELWVIERHGYRGYVSTTWDAGRTVLAIKHLEAF